MKDVVDILMELIALPSVNPMGGGELPPGLAGEARVNEYLLDFIKGIGLDPFVQGTGLPGRDNVGATLHRGGRRKTIILQCHTDTVGVGDNMQLLSPRLRGGRVHGRGACDCKGGLAAMLAALAEAAKRPREIKANVIVMGVSDEEYSFKGSLALCAQEPTKGADFGVIGEPTESRIVNGFKGVARWDITTEGKAFHSSEPEKGVNAIYRMAKIVGLIEEYQQGLRAVTDDVLGGETVSVGVIAGGRSVNIVPDSCAIQVDRRLTRLTSPARARSGLAAFLRRNGCEGFAFSALKDAQPATLVEGSHPGIRMMMRASAGMGLASEPVQVAFGSDAFRMNAGGIPTVLWGPGSIAVAHVDEEHVEVARLRQATQFYYDIMTGALADS